MSTLLGDGHHPKPVVIITVRCSCGATELQKDFTPKGNATLCRCGSFAQIVTIASQVQEEK